MQTNRSNHSFIRFLALSLTVCMLISTLSGCYFLPAEEDILTPPLKEPEAVTYRTHTVSTGDLEYFVQGKGYIESVSSETLQFGNVSGKLTDIYVKAGDEITEGQLIAELESGDLKYSIQEQQISVKISETNLKVAQKGGDPNSIDIAKYNLELARMKLQKLKDQLEARRLYAPFDGVIVYMSDVRPGDTISAYKTIAQVADPNDLRISFVHDELTKLVHGMVLDIRIADLVTVTGTVVQVPADVPASAPEADKKSVKISLDAKPSDYPELKNYEYKIGDSVYVSVLLDSRTDVVVLPTSYIQKVNTRRYVKVLNNGIPEERDIQLGLQSGNVVEIVSGLEPGEVIII